ncbi:tRNA 2-thiouridine(34) synthase MnmA [Phorcysia thermohydrogeniphila]|uniref:tRNA-specific 2-thiouridylase MnmA n=1 Tax=Phorcysia thermohydrogeniphila TaxID=936138 RepID=A0A4R1GDT6_9BACT|nr:tRNA 2-thiouridine(34) synthase MnmA [Phorcysia thermohydrogeniphila]TCK03859.1 tRNA (5-methylaminomethyl-2-thiouridylate)-methyltransferase [Phorcysia thermohydrogeniphila]
MKRVVVGLSGGVDSFYTAYLLKERGYEVIPVFFRLTQKASPEKAQKAAELLGLKLSVIDLTDQFQKEVIDYFVRYYRKGLTPNPCAVCNRKIKLNYLYLLMKEFGADFIATGHYARVVFSKEWGKHLVLRGKDRRKEQSYFLSLVEQRVFERLLLPLGEFTKDEVIKRAKAIGFPFESESQDICFIEGDYVSFVEQFVKPPPGLFVLKDGTVVGRHKGYHRYTVGQRRGLGISYGKPLYVVEIDAENNRVILGGKEDVLKSTVYVWNVNWHLEYEKVKELKGLQVQVRYRSRPVPVESVEYLKNGFYYVKLAAKVDAPAPGQVCAFYSGDLLLGGGEITKQGEG